MTTTEATGLIETVVSISVSKPSSFDVAGFTALSDWTAIGGVTNVGNLESEHEDKSVTSLNGIKHVIRGKTNHASFDIEVLELNDAGEDTLRAAFDAKSLVSLKLDIPNGTVRYTYGAVMKVSDKIGSESENKSVAFTFVPEIQNIKA